jgi:predicted ribonuclease YlaK
VKQIDCVSPRFLDEHSNGLSVTIDRWKGSEVYGHISLQKNVRSTLSMEAESRFSF